MFFTSSSGPPLLDITSILAAEPPAVEARSGDDSECNTDAAKRPAARILVVEDDWFAGMDMQGALQDAGFTVLDLVTSAEEAVEAARTHEPDIVIMDVSLVGERDGVDAALEIGRRFDIRCLFVSAFVDPSLRSRAEPARPYGWLTKPIGGDAVAAAVKRALERG